MPISTLDIYRCRKPDKIYGKEIGSNYFAQIGTRPAKHFKKFDFKRAGKNYAKLDKTCLVKAVLKITNDFNCLYDVIRR